MFTRRRRTDAGLTAALIAAALVTAAIAGMPAVTYGQAARTITVSMSDYKFQPERWTVRAGQRVTLVLRNISPQRKLHEFSVGREIVQDRRGQPAGYRRDFFAGVALQASATKGVWQMHAGEARMIGPMVKTEMSGMAMAGHAGFMIELMAGGTATLTFTVPPDRVGEWEIGCFSEAGEHYGKGMKGRLLVVR